MGRRGYNMALDSIANIGTGLDDAAISGLRFGADQAQRKFSNNLATMQERRAQAQFDADQAWLPTKRRFMQLEADNEIAKRENERGDLYVRDKRIDMDKTLAEINGRSKMLGELAGKMTPDDVGALYDMMQTDAAPEEIAKFAIGASKRVNAAAAAKVAGEESARQTQKNKGAAARSRAAAAGERAKMIETNPATPLVDPGISPTPGVPAVAPEDIIFTKPTDASKAQYRDKNERTLERTIKNARDALTAAKRGQKTYDLRVPEVLALVNALNSQDEAAIRAATDALYATLAKPRAGARKLTD